MYTFIILSLTQRFTLALALRHVAYSMILSNSSHEPMTSITDHRPSCIFIARGGIWDNHFRLILSNRITILDNF